MTQTVRRTFLKTSAASIAALASAQSLGQQNTSPSQGNVETQLMTAQRDADSTADWNDGLVHPAPYSNPPGAGKERGMALGGGGTPLIAWYAGYFHALKKNGVDLSNADVIVGTSAGSIFGAMLSSGHLWRIVAEMDFFNDFPKIFADLVPAVQFNNSQKRAMASALTVTDASPASIQRIGKAAMAARNPDGESKYYKVMGKILTSNAWPSPRMHTTTIDCYTGQRLVVSEASGVPINAACAASSSAPGQMGPTFIKDRLCMDGGISQSSTHSDVIRGVKRALVFSLGDGSSNDQKQGLHLSTLPNTVSQEVKDLEAGGTRTRHIIVGLPPGITKVENLVDPKWIGSYLKFGFDRGVADVATMKAFWL